MMENKNRYIHYGHDSFDRDLFVPIYNEVMFTKPGGGLWASQIDAKFGWYEWCRVNGFRTNRLVKSFMFTLSEKARVVHIRSVADLKELPGQKNPVWFGNSQWKCIDFEKLLADGVDAVELHLSEEDLTGCGFMEGLYWELYGWDCDSILIMNPDVVEVV